MEYYRLIIRLYRDRVQDGSYPPLIINSIDLKKMLSLAGAADEDGLAAYMLEEIHKLAKAGADFGLMSSNTPHLVFDAINRRSPIPLFDTTRIHVECAVDTMLTRSLLCVVPQIKMLL